MSALPILTVSRGAETVKSLPVEADVSIGRGEGNVIRLDDRAISRKHAVIRNTAEGVQIEKQSDFAPIRLNGVECTRALLKEGDVVEIGPYRVKLEQNKQDEKKSEKKAEKRSAPAQAAPAPEDEKLEFRPVEPANSSSDATQVLSSNSTLTLGGEIPEMMNGDSNFQVAESMPGNTGTLATTEVPPENVLSDLSAQLLGGNPEGIRAEPINADGAGAELGGLDPGTNIFDTPSVPDTAPDIVPGVNDLGMPIDASHEIHAAIPIDENAATRVLQKAIEARIEIPEGRANVASLDLTKEETFLGRGKECDVILNDKKSSRKNTVIARTGNHYVVRDLGSSNGTYVNGQSIQEHELSADDVIRVGEVEIRFLAISSDYEKKKSKFKPVESFTQPPPADPVNPYDGSSSPYVAPQTSPYGEAFPQHSPLSDFNSGGFAQAPYAPGGFSGQPDFAATGGTPTRKGLWGAYDKYFRNFKTLRPVQKLLVVLCVGYFLSWYFEEELGLVEKPKQVMVKKPTGAHPGQPATDYDKLNEKQRAQIDEAIAKATDLLRTYDFDKAIYEIQQKVYPILPDYPRAKEVERYAQEGKRRKEAIEAENRKKEEEAKLKVRIAELETQTRDLMSKKKYEEAKESFAEILTLDPENLAVGEWRKEIEGWMEEQARIEQERQVQEEINKRAWDTYNEGFELHKAGKFRDAIAIYKKVSELGANDSVLIRKTDTMIKTCQDSVRELRDPHLKRAKEFETSQDLGSAFREYKFATEIDPPHSEGWAGMERIRDVLDQRAKILYTEGVIAESYSDFKTAHAKFAEITKTAPEGSLYFERAQRKLQSYLNFKATHEEEGAIE